MKPFLRKKFILYFLILCISLFIVPQSFAQSCTTPTTPQNVKITYPNCDATNCSYTNASCSWETISGASSYTVIVTETDTSTTVYNQSTSVTTITFPVTNGKTYKCDVTPVNSCGTSGGTGSDSLLCQVDGLTVSPGVSSAPQPTQATAPTIAPTGILDNTFLIGGITLIFITVGGLLLLI